MTKLTSGLMQSAETKTYSPLDVFFSNRIMTGVRIVKHNQIIHIQIQEGELGPRGVINTTTVTWKPVDNYTVFDLDTENGVDYHTLHWNDRGIDIDDTFGPAENVLTGILLNQSCTA